MDSPVAAEEEKEEEEELQDGAAPSVDNRPIEVIIEEKRSKLYSSGKKLTPVTPRTCCLKKEISCQQSKIGEEKKRATNFQDEMPF